jgi:hypothetical protein
MINPDPEKDHRARDQDRSVWLPRDPDEGLTAQDHENQAWAAHEVILVGIALLAVIALLCACLGSFGRGYW